MSTQRIAVLGLTGLLMLAGLPTAEADARVKGLRMGADGPFVKILQRNLTPRGLQHRGRRRSSARRRTAR